MGLYPAFAIQIPKPMFREPSLISGKLFQALIKIYVRLVIAQYIQLSNIVLADLHQLPASAGMGLTHFRSCTILKLLQPNVRRQLFADAQRRIGILVELTGIEPVASWLQTRRSPS